MLPMLSIPVLLLEVAACVGLGAAALRLLNIGDHMRWGERAVFAFVLGIGVLGWLMFFVGVLDMFNVTAMVTLLTLAAMGLGFLGRPTAGPDAPYLMIERVLLAVLILVAALDLMEGLSPPADADSMAYHFALPKLFWQSDQLTFVPRAVDGAIPLLVQMTYIPVLGLGGEKAMTLWTMVSGWGVAGALYFLCRHYLDRPWSLATVLIWLTTPVVLYGGGSGQIEVRNAGFVIVTVAALLRGRETGFVRYAVLAGMATGMFVGAKYTGLFFAAACGAALFTVRRRSLALFLFSIAVWLVGFQWYAWNWIHTGDPVFPMLYGVLDYGGHEFWDEAHHQAMRQNLFVSENAIPVTLLSALKYPFLATFSTSAIFDSERAGLGLILLAVLPFAVAGFWRFRARLSSSPLLTAAVVVIFYYALWFFSGSSQRVRHLVPIYPVALMMAMTLSCRWSQITGTEKPLVLAAALVLGLQLAADSASSINYMRYQFSGESRDGFLARNISGYNAVQWLNKNLEPTDRVLIDRRELIYLVDVPTFYAHTSNQNLIDVRLQAFNPSLYYQQLKKTGITHILAITDTIDENRSSGGSNGSNQWKVLLSMGCVEEIQRLKYNGISSRSLAMSVESAQQQLILRVGGRSCPLSG